MTTKNPRSSRGRPDTLTGRVWSGSNRQCPACVAARSQATKTRKTGAIDSTSRRTCPSTPRWKNQFSGSVPMRQNASIAAYASCLTGSGGPVSERGDLGPAPDLGLVAGDEGVDRSAVDRERVVRREQPAQDLLVVHPAVGQHGEGALQLVPRRRLVEELDRHADHPALARAPREQLTVGQVLADPSERHAPALGDVRNR